MKNNDSEVSYKWMRIKERQENKASKQNSIKGKGTHYWEYGSFFFFLVNNILHSNKGKAPKKPQQRRLT